MLTAQPTPTRVRASRAAAPPLPGARLRMAIDKALPLIGEPRAEAELVAGLAWTAACGDTCRVLGAVGHVRAAIAALRAHEDKDARIELDAAVAALTPPLPRQRHL